eukprot:TRINITY_DN41708_c0_g1_i1.p1 TRINITY_DN41708_c0_g1~~TRINITY_DN41708_c0_g1_i1.p1  ORF type:complete len:484 (-),score=87.02 TRINITY_DN41708_c0_g1_i1:493-1872(-)
MSTADCLKVASDAKHKRMRVMMENSDTYSDVEFRVGEDHVKFLGLKAMFARASEVFCKMFFEACFRERMDGPLVVVDVPDARPAAFEQLHRWVYDMDVVLISEVVFDVLILARKYMVEDLEVHCQRWIAATGRTMNGALEIFAAATNAGWSPECIFGRVESFGTASALRSPALKLLPIEAFAKIVNCPDCAPASEEDVFNAVKGWADAAAERGETPAESWKAAVDAGIIKFNLLDQRFLAERVVMPGLLSKEHALSVFVDMSMGCQQPRETSLLGRLRAILSGVEAEDAFAQIEPLVALCAEEGYAAALAHCLVERAVIDNEKTSEWVSMWSELWGALRVSRMRDACVRAVVDRCQNLFENQPSENCVFNVWVCPRDTLSLVRILRKLNDMRNLAVLPLVKVLEALIESAEEGTHQSCAPADVAKDLAGHLTEVAQRSPMLSSLQELPSLRRRIAALAL